MTPKSHQHICQKVADSILAPAGFVQKGRSRFWYDDRSWCAACIEFQPFSNRRGSAMNAGVTWLWNPKDYWSYDVGGRVGNFIENNDDVTFESKLMRMTKKALKTSLKNRNSLGTPEDACALIKRDRSKDSGWRNFHLGIAAGLSRQEQLAERSLRSVIVEDSEIDWIQYRNNAALELLKHVNSHNEFRALVESKITKTRFLLKLPPLSEAVFPIKKAP